MNSAGAEPAWQPGEGEAGPGPAPPVPRLVPAVLVASGGLLALATLALFHDAFVDDAFISLRYVRNFLAGNGLVFNVGERVEGFTNLGQVLLLIGLGRAGLDLQLGARLLGLVGMGLAVWLGPAAILPGPRQALARAIARLLLLSNFAFVYLASTGLETGLYTGTVAAAAWAFARAEGRFDAATGLLASAAYLVRPDGLLIGGALGLLALRRRGFAATLRAAGPWLLAGTVAAVAVWRLAYYGTWVPNTALVKGTLSFRGGEGLPWYGTFGDDLVELLAQTGGALALLPALLALGRHPDRLRVELALALCAAVFAFELYAGGDWMLGYRFLQPLLPFYLSLVGFGVADLYRRTALRGSRLAAPLFVGALLVVATSCWSYGLEFRQHQDEYPEYHMTSWLMTDAAHGLDGRYAPGTQIAADYIGALGYFTDLTVIDKFGLTDATIARAGHDPAARTAYIASRRPELVLVVRNPLLAYPPEQEMYGGRYRFVELLPMGVADPWLLYERVGELEGQGAAAE